MPTIHHPAFYARGSGKTQAPLIRHGDSGFLQEGDTKWRQENILWWLNQLLQAQVPCSTQIGIQLLGFQSLVTACAFHSTSFLALYVCTEFSNPPNLSAIRCAITKFRFCSLQQRTLINLEGRKIFPNIVFKIVNIIYYLLLSWTCSSTRQ